MRPRLLRPFALPLVGLGAALLAASCATAPAPQRQPAVFFPPAPELPRIQYLTSFSGRRDVERQSSFDRFVVGELQEIKLDKPYGVAVHDGKIYVCDTNAGVVVFDLEAKKFGMLKGNTGRGKLVQPVNISIEPDGTKYVADPVRGDVAVYDRNDEYVRSFVLAEPWRPVDAVPFEGRLYVADSAKARIWVFDKPSGELVKVIGDQGEPEVRLDRPTNLAFDRRGNLYVSDMGRFQIVKYDRDGHFKATIGKVGDNLGHFARPKGVAVDREGRVYVVDSSFNTVQIFNDQGRLLMFFGNPGQETGNLLLPAQVTIDYDNVSLFRQYAAADFEIEYLILVTSQFGPRPINVLAYGHEKGRKYPTDDELLRIVDERRRKELEKLKAAPAPAPAEPAVPAPPPAPESPPVSP